MHIYMISEALVPDGGDVDVRAMEALGQRRTGKSVSLGRWCLHPRSALSVSLSKSEWDAMS